MDTHWGGCGYLTSVCHGVVVFIQPLSPIDQSPHRHEYAPRIPATKPFTEDPLETPAHSTQTVFRLTNSWMPIADSSRPYPDSPTPPNGTRGSDLTSWFT